MRERETGWLCTDPLSRAELGAAAKALAASSLPADDVEAGDVKLFAFKQGGRTVGYGGLEIHGDAALLRSILVDPGARRQGFGFRIVEELIARAADGRARRAFLLTTNAANYFKRFDFAVVDRKDARQAILATREAAGLCPATATLMAKMLAQGPE